ncbi:MAG: hypothetical protein WAN43_08970 [Rhodomicrobium sp.]
MDRAKLYKRLEAEPSRSTVEEAALHFKHAREVAELRERHRSENLRDVGKPYGYRTVARERKRAMNARHAEELARLRRRHDAEAAMLKRQPPAAAKARRAA